MFKMLYTKNTCLIESSQPSGDFRYSMGIYKEGTFYAMTPFFMCKDYMNIFFACQDLGKELPQDYGYKAMPFAEYNVEDLCLALAIGRADISENAYNHAMPSGLVKFSKDLAPLTELYSELTEEGRMLYIRPPHWATRSSLSFQTWYCMLRMIYVAKVKYDWPITFSNDLCNVFSSESTILTQYKGAGHYDTSDYKLFNESSMPQILYTEWEGIFPKDSAVMRLPNTELAITKYAGNITGYHDATGPLSLFRHLTQYEGKYKNQATEIWGGDIANYFYDRLKTGTNN